MTTLLEAIIPLEKELRLEKGAFTLFALFLREEGIGKWDLVVAAPWMDRDNKLALQRIYDWLQDHVSTELMLQISRTVIIQMDNPMLPEIVERFQDNTSVTTVHYEEFFGHAIKTAHIIAVSTQYLKQALA